MSDFIFRGSLADLDPDIYKLTQLESERQLRKLILIPSESAAPLAVREALASSFQNIYAEGYPDEETRWMSEEQILNYEERLTHYRRYADPRYYKGVEYADVVESLARRRCSEAFANERVSADNLYANVQPLSGAPANNAVYTALISPGDTILGMNLLHGGHLSHGSSVNRSGKLYKAVHYNIDPASEKIDYGAIAALAIEHRPKIIIAGYSSYPWVPDYAEYRKIADSVGAYLLADISHIAGLTAAGVIDSPVGYAHVITFTTHKTLCGPRGACILTSDLALARKIDRGVFPGEQGGPHVHVFAALALTFKLAKTKEFKNLQTQIIKNCAALSNQLQERGFHIPFGGTNTHLSNIDCKTIKGPDGTTLSGDIAARILDIAGLVCNRNTIPGDKTANNPSGVRFGTPWMTQRGLKEADMVKVADIMADILQAAIPYSVNTKQGLQSRAKVDFDVLEAAKIKVRDLAVKAGAEAEHESSGYPHFYYLDDPAPEKDGWSAIDLVGDKVKTFAQFVFTSDLDSLTQKQSVNTQFIANKQTIEGTLTSIAPDHILLSIPSSNAPLAVAWLRGLSDGYIGFDDDLARRFAGPLTVRYSMLSPVKSGQGDAVHNAKPYAPGLVSTKQTALPDFTWVEPSEEPIKKTALNETHRKLGAKMVPFAGWDMPVWYTGVIEEHLATRQAAGLFDVSHMGVYQAEGPDAPVFLDCVCGNDISALEVGESCYTHFLDPMSNVIDDSLVYRRSEMNYLVVVNASNDDKDWAWLNAVREGKVAVDISRPWVKVVGRNVILRNLRDPKEGKDMRVDIALQGPKSREILLLLGTDKTSEKKIKALKRTELCEAIVGGFDLVVSRTGYTGEKMAFELFVHPDKSVELWNKLLEAGQLMGIKPCGLGSRDSLRTEAGLPLYGHEMGGEMNFSVSEAGFGSYIKTYKPWFIGRDEFVLKEQGRKGVVCRFRFLEKGIRMAHNGDPVVDKKGRVIGVVTSCAVDSEGFFTGQAFLELKSAVECTPIAIYQSAHSLGSQNPGELKSGDKISLPANAVVQSRFPKLTA
jgi:glycine hydroxymethyltransferase